MNEDGNSRYGGGVSDFKPRSLGNAEQRVVDQGKPMPRWLLVLGVSTMACGLGSACLWAILTFGQ